MVTTIVHGGGSIDRVATLRICLVGTNCRLVSATYKFAHLRVVRYMVGVWMVSRASNADVGTLTVEPIDVSSKLFE